jgi:hypothetical protein
LLARFSRRAVKPPSAGDRENYLGIAVLASVLVALMNRSKTNALDRAPRHDCNG